MYKIKRILYYLFHNPSVLANIFLEYVSPLIPDKLYLSMRYRLVVGKRLNLKNPKTFCEKIQWLKLYNRKPEFTVMVDKVKVKEYVAEKLGEEYIIPTIGVWNTPEEIDFDKLPDKFVLKCNHNSGTGMYICKDKSRMDIAKVRTGLWMGLKEDYFLHSREWPYKNVMRKILAEKFMEDKNTSELRDYKFFCFDGVAKYCQVISDRSTEEKIDFYDMDWNRLIGLIGLIGLSPSHVIRNSEESIECPKTLEDMKRMASILSKDIPFARIDFYEINGRAYFGEITFFPAGGFGFFRPDEWNRKLGDMININVN